VADDQRGPEYGAEVASFFLSSFLGCRLKIEPRVATKEVFVATEEFINDEVDEPEHKARYAIALAAQMNATTRDLRPRDFAEANLELEDRRADRDYLKERGIDPDQTIEKDTALIENRVRRVRVDTEHNLVVMGPSDELDARMDVSVDHLVIRDRVVHTRGG
jgi:hypothetical protein